jgi:general secretion pathway protein L
VLILTPTDFSRSAATPTSGLDWVRSSNGLQAADHGSCAPSLLPADTDVVLVLPPRSVSWHRVALPKVAAGRLRAALDGMLEDRLLDDPAKLHFALEPQGRPGQTLWVAACEKSWLTSWLQVLDAAGRPVSRIVPALWPTLAGGNDSGDVVHWAHQEGDRVWLASASPQGVRCVSLREQGASVFGDSALGALGPGSGGATESAPLVADPGTTRWFADPSVTALAEQLCNERFELMPPPAWLVRCAQSDWNLAQFDLSLSSGARRGQRLRQALRQWRSAPAWRPARWGLAALVLSLVVGLNALAWMERNSLNVKQQAATRLLQSTFPEVTVVLDAPAQMRRSLARLQQSTGTLSHDDLEAMLAAVAAGAPDASPGSIDFDTGSARLGAWTIPQDRLASLQQNLRGMGWQATLDGGSLRIQPRAAP